MELSLDQLVDQLSNGAVLKPVIVTGKPAHHKWIPKPILPDLLTGGGLTCQSSANALSGKFTSHPLTGAFGSVGKQPSLKCSHQLGTNLGRSYPIPPKTGHNCRFMPVSVAIL